MLFRDPRKQDDPLFRVIVIHKETKANIYEGLGHDT